MKLVKVQVTLSSSRDVWVNTGTREDLSVEERKQRLILEVAEELKHYALNELLSPFRTGSWKLGIDIEERT
jgi:hypothetical protein